jgi:hypothetical protein
MFRLNLKSARAENLRWDPFLTLILAGAVALAGCSRTPQAQQPSSAPAQAMAQAQNTVPTPPLSEAKAAVRRVFKDAAVIDEDRNPSFVVGDFNGDLSQDIAVILKVAPGRVASMNQQLPPWILKDPFVTATPRTAPLQVSASDGLLAVIHGFGVEGWRDAQATQTFLLKNALGEDIEPRGKAEVIAANQGRKFPKLKGDLISEKVRGASGYLYYAESTYSWYDPLTFKEELESKPVHAGMGRRSMP